MGNISLYRASGAICTEMTMDDANKKETSDQAVWSTLFLLGGITQYNARRIIMPRVIPLSLSVCHLHLDHDQRCFKGLKGFQQVLVTSGSDQNDASFHEPGFVKE
jgi:hypothetical protein